MLRCRSSLEPVTVISSNSLGQGGAGRSTGFAGERVSIDCVVGATADSKMRTVRSFRNWKLSPVPSRSRVSAFAAREASASLLLTHAPLRYEKMYTSCSPVWWRKIPRERPASGCGAIPVRDKARSSDLAVPIQNPSRIPSSECVIQRAAPRRQKNRHGSR